MTETRRWFNDAVEAARETFKFGHPAQERLDPVVLRAAVDDLDQSVSALRKSATATTTLADAIEEALATDPPPRPEPMWKDATTGCGVMAARKNPLERGRWWDNTWNPVGGCKMADHSCDFCYAPWRAAGIQTATDTALYLDTTKWEDERWTWNRRLTEWPPDHPVGTFLLTGRIEIPLLGPDKPSCSGSAAWPTCLCRGDHARSSTASSPRSPTQNTSGFFSPSTQSIWRNISACSPRGCVGTSGWAFRRATRRVLTSAGSGCVRSPNRAGWSLSASSRYLQPVSCRPIFWRLAAG